MQSIVRVVEDGTKKPFIRLVHKHFTKSGKSVGRPRLHCRITPQLVEYQH